MKAQGNIYEPQAHRYLGSDSGKLRCIWKVIDGIDDVVEALW